MKTAALAVALTLSSLAAHAEPYGFYACNFRDGKTMADLDAWLPKFRAAAERVKDGGTVVILTPQYAANPPDFLWMEFNPDAGLLGIGLRDWFEKGVGNEAEAELAAIADCSSETSLWWGRTVYRQTK